MTTYESNVKTIYRSQEAVFHLLSDLSNLQKIQNAVAEGNEKAGEYLQDVTFTPDAVAFSVTGVGRVGFRIIEREPFKTIKLEAEGASMAANGWIQLLAVSEEETKMKVTFKAELPTMIKMMVDGKLKKGIDVIADAIAAAVGGVKSETN